MRHSILVIVKIRDRFWFNVLDGGKDGLFKGSGIPQELTYQNIKAYVNDYPEESEQYREVLAYFEGAFLTT